MNKWKPARGGKRPGCRMPRRRINWDAQPLGLVDDCSLARQIGVSSTAVRYHRRRRGLPADAPEPVIDWDNQPLGLATDTDIALRLGVSSAAVRKQRIKRGFPAFDERASRSGRVAGKRRGYASRTNWDAQPLGVDTDSEIARRLGVSVKSVRLEREKRGLLPVESTYKSKGVDWAFQPLGTVPDRTLAARLGVSLAAVSYQRRRRHIPPSPSRRGGARTGAGRPRESAQVAVRLPLGVVETLDALAELEGVSRSDMVRRLIEDGLDVEAGRER